MRSKSVRIEGRGQFVTYVEHGTLDPNATLTSVPHTVRVTVRLGGHRCQSWGTLERWNGSEWWGVVRIDGEALLVDPNVGYWRKVTREMFAADRDRLVELAEEVL